MPAEFQSDSLFLIAALGFLILMMFLSSRKRKRAAAELQSSLKVGASVMLTSGIYGDVLAIDGDKVTIQSAGSTKIEVNKGAIARIEASAKPAAKRPAAKTAASSNATKSVSKPAAKKPASK